MSHEHKFQKLSETAIFCVCGEIRQAPVQHACGCYHVCTHWHYPTVTYPTWTLTPMTSGTTTTYIGSTTGYDPNNVTLT